MTETVVNKLKHLKNKSNHHQHKVSALILFRGRPISFGYNDSKKTHPIIKRYSDVKTIHAETSALFKIKDKAILKDCTMVVYREDRTGNMAMSRPCEVCEAIMRDYGIMNIIYSTSEGWKEEEYVA